MRYPRSKRRLMELAGLNEYGNAQFNAKKDVPENERAFFQDLFSDLSRRYNIEYAEPVEKTKWGTTMYVRIYDLFDPRSGVEDDDHPDVNKREFDNVFKMAHRLQKIHKLQKRKFELGPQEKYWVDLTLRK